MKISNLTLIIFAIFCSCTAPRKKKKFEHFDKNLPAEYSICELKNYLELDSIDIITENTELILHQIDKNPQLNENCIFSLIDSISFLLGSTESLKYLIAFESFCKQSDGFLSDYLQSKAIQLFENNIFVVANYFYNNPDSHLLESLVHGYSINVAMLPKDEREIAMAKSKSRILKKIRENNLDENIVEFSIKNIINKIDPSIYL